MSDEQKLEINYPCEWEYRLIGRDAVQLRAAAVAVAGEAKHSVTEGNRSQTGKYCSLSLTVLVVDEPHRQKIFADLRGRPEVMMMM